MPPGVDHAFFSPGDRQGARHRTRPRRPSRAPVRRTHPAAQGTRRRGARARRARPSGRACSSSSAVRAARRATRTWPRSSRWLRRWASPSACGSCRPQPHHLLSTYYRAADVCLVPSRSESFGLVALEAAACGTPGRGGRSRRPAHARRPRPHRASSSRVGTRRCSRRTSEQLLDDPACSPPRWAPRPRPAPAATRGRRPRRGCAGSTPTSPLGALVELLADAASPGDRFDELDAHRGAHRRVAAATAGREPDARGRRSRRARRAALVRAAARRGEGRSRRSGSRSASARCTTRPT